MASVTGFADLRTGVNRGWVPRLEAPNLLGLCLLMTVGLVLVYPVALCS